MQCELCGRECDCRPATVDGVNMLLCPSCMRYGKGIVVSDELSGVSKKPILERIKSRPSLSQVLVCL